MDKCLKCGRDISQARDYGGYLVSINKSLCNTCLKQYIKMKKEHYKEETEYLYSCFEGEENQKNV